MEFTKEQVSELIYKQTEKENGLHDLMEIMLEQEQRIPSWSDLRTRMDIEFRIPRDWYGSPSPHTGHTA